MRAKVSVQTRETRAWLVKVSHVLKGFLTWHGKPLLKTHDLRLLGDRCAAIDASLGLLSYRTDYLSEFAVQGRYPGEDRDPSPGEARRALKLAREVVKAVLDRLPAEVRSTGIRL